MNTLPDKNIMCHRTRFAKTCRECVVEHNCQLWTQIIGVNPNTGEEMNRFGCADQFIPLLLIENSQMQRQTGAAVESFRNEMVKLNRRVWDDETNSHGLRIERHGNGS